MHILVTVQVCIGSACHIGGSHDIITGLQDIIEEKNLKDKVDLKAVFCMGQCEGAVCTRVNGKKICSVSPKGVEDYFNTHVLPEIE